MRNPEPQHPIPHILRSFFGRSRGLIVGGLPDDSRLVHQLAVEYISKESCIILLTIACETDFENQSAHRLAAQFDPSGARTIGVLTKPDRISTGDEGVWISKIQRGCKGGGIEYFSVKNPDSQEIRDGITYEQARKKEAVFFTTKAPWSNLEWLYQRRLGTDKLTARLGQLLSSLISRRLPELQEELNRLLAQTQDEICQLPSPPSSEPISEILKLIGAFVQSTKNLVDGIIPGATHDGLIQTLRGPRDEFRKAIRQTAPYFYHSSVLNSLTLHQFLLLSFQAKKRSGRTSLVMAVRRFSLKMS